MFKMRLKTINPFQKSIYKEDMRKLIVCKQGLHNRKSKDIVRTYEDYIYEITNMHLYYSKTIDWDQQDNDIYIESPIHYSSTKETSNKKTKNFINILLGKIEKFSFMLNKKKYQDFLDNDKFGSTINTDLSYEKWAKNGIISKDINVIKELLISQIELEIAGILELSDFNISDDIVTINISLNSESIIPKESFIMPRLGYLKVNELSKEDYLSILKSYIISLSIRIASEFFAIIGYNTICIIIYDNNPSIEATDGAEANLRVIFDKDKLSNINFRTTDIQKILGNFDNKLSIS